MQNDKSATQNLFLKSKKKFIANFVWYGTLQGNDGNPNRKGKKKIAKWKR